MIWPYLAGAALMVAAAAMLHALAARRARAIEASASEDRAHELRVATSRLTRVATICGFVIPSAVFISAVVRSERIGARALLALLLAIAACGLLLTAVARRPVLMAIARARGIPPRALRSYRQRAMAAIASAVMLSPLITVLAISASLTARICVAVAGYLVVCPLLLGLLAPLLARIHGPAALPADVADRLSRLAGQAGVRVHGRVIPARARKFAGAFEAGWIPSLRYVLVTDYLLDELAGSDIDAVLAHEISHARHHDPLVRQFIASVSMLPSAILLVAMTANAWVLVLIALLGLAPFPALVSWWRSDAIRRELAADELAARLVGPAVLASALARLTELNAIKRETTLEWDRRVGHPGMAQRVERLQQMMTATETPG